MRLERRDNKRRAQTADKGEHGVTGGEASLAGQLLHARSATGCIHQHSGKPNACFRFSQNPPLGLKIRTGDLRGAT